MGKKVVYPRITCRSLNVVPVTTDRKLSIGKGVVGGMLLGPIGAAAGALSGKRGKTIFRCMDCGRTFEVKL